MKADVKNGAKKASQRKAQNRKAWNKGKTVGQKAPFPPDAILVIRHMLKDVPRDLALFNTAIDTMLRASDLLTLRVEDVTDHNGEVIEEGETRQSKTGIGASFVLKDKARAALAAWIAASGKFPGDYLFTSLRKDTLGQPISRVQYSRLIKKWAEYARLDPRRYSTHSGRRTKSSIIYAKTKNLAACRELLGQKDIGSTARYLGVDRRQALNLAKDIDV